MHIHGRFSHFVGGALLLVLMSAAPAWARVVKLSSSVPLADYSDASLDQAIKSATDSCVRDATAMGLSWIWLRDAAVMGDKLVVRMVATDDESEDEDLTVLDVLPGAKL